MQYKRIVAKGKYKDGPWFMIGIWSIKHVDEHLSFLLFARNNMDSHLTICGDAHFFSPALSLTNEDLKIHVPHSLKATTFMWIHILKNRDGPSAAFWRTRARLGVHGFWHEHETCAPEVFSYLLNYIRNNLYYSFLLETVWSLFSLCPRNKYLSRYRAQWHEPTPAGSGVQKTW